MYKRITLDDLKPVCKVMGEEDPTDVARLGPLAFNLGSEAPWVILNVGWDTCIPVATNKTLVYLDDRLWDTSGLAMRVYEPSLHDVLHLANHGLWCLRRQLRRIYQAIRGIRCPPWEELWPVVDEVTGDRGLVLGDEVLRCKMNSWDTGSRKVIKPTGSVYVEKEQWGSYLLGEALRVQRKLSKRHDMMYSQYTYLQDLRDVMVTEWADKLVEPLPQLELPLQTT